MNNTIQKYRKKPVVIEAIQLSDDTFDLVCDWIGEDNVGDGTSKDEQYICISTLEGEMDARYGDYIIKGIKGEFYPCRSDIFEATYEDA